MCLVGLNGVVAWFGEFLVLYWLLRYFFKSDVCPLYVECREKKRQFCCICGGLNP